jgi:glycosyltransferase involved in cell wall biosynthesis
MQIIGKNMKHSQEHIREGNIAIAKMLGWTYVSSLDVNNKVYGTLPAGWYSKIPKIRFPKINRILFKGRSHNDLKFHYDFNWCLNYAIEWMERKHKMNIKISSFWITIETTSDSKLNFKSCNIPHSQLVDDYDKSEALFEALYIFSQHLIK